MQLASDPFALLEDRAVENQLVQPGVLDRERDPVADPLEQPALVRALERSLAASCNSEHPDRPRGAAERKRAERLQAQRCHLVVREPRIHASVVDDDDRRGRCRDAEAPRRGGGGTAIRTRLLRRPGGTRA